MASTAARRFVLSSIVGGLAAALAYGCSTQGTAVRPDVDLGLKSIHGFAVTKSFQREANGGGLVTVDVAVIPGALPAWASHPGAPETIGWFSNRGEGGKREKRYSFKPNRDTVYELVLSNDTSARTKWTIYEWKGGVRTPHRQGHLWACQDSTHGSVGRNIDFRDCDVRVPYDSAEFTGSAPTFRHFLASYARSYESEDDPALLTISSAAWISCTTGCCSLGL